MNRVMETEVTNLWKRVSAKEKNAYSSCDNVIGMGNIGDYVYTPSLIQEKECIEQLNHFLNLIELDQDDLHFYDLLKTKDGNTWTEFHQKLDFLASMLNAVGILQYEEEPIYYPMKKSNPKIKIIK